MTDDKLEIDLSDDTDAQPADDQPPEPRSAEPADEPQSDLREEAKQEAIRYRDNSEGRNQAEKCENAIEKVGQEYQTAEKQLRQAKQQKQEAENRIESLEETKERVRDQPPECEIVQTMGGGISLEVPPPEEQPDSYNRDDLCEEIDETIEALEENLDGADEHVSQLEYATQKLQLAAQILQKAHKRAKEEQSMVNEVAGQGGAAAPPDASPGGGW